MRMINSTVFRFEILQLKNQLKTNLQHQNQQRKRKSLRRKCRKKQKLRQNSSKHRTSFDDLNQTDVHKSFVISKQLFANVLVK